MADPTWSENLQTSLGYWSTGQCDVAGKGLQRVIGQLQGPDHAMWRAFVYNLLALLSNQMGHWQFARDQWDMAQECWAQSGVEPGDNSLQPTLQWYAQLLQHYGFSSRAAHLLQLHAAHRPPLLDPWQDTAEGSSFAQVTPVTATPARPIYVPEDQLGYAPLGGQTLSSRGTPLTPSDEVPLEWDGHLNRALRLAAEGKLPRALSCIDRAKDQATARRERDNGHLLSLIYNAESLVCFLGGDYPEASQSKEEGARLWSMAVKSMNPFAGETHARYLQVLKDAGQSRAAQLFEQRHQRSQCPLIDPWSDLEVGLQTGDWESQSFNLQQDWKTRMEGALQQHARGNLTQSQQELGLLEKLMSPEQMQQAPGALLMQMQSVLAYAIGEYDSAQILFTKAVSVWDRLKPTEKREGPFWGQLMSLVTMYGLEAMAEPLKTGLCDPFAFYRRQHQLQRVEEVEQASEEIGDPRQQWERQMVQAWDMARKGRWDQARRQAAHAQKVAQLINNQDLRVAYSLNTQAIFAQNAGDYSDSGELQENAVRAWRKGSHLPAARTAYSEFCDILHQTQWTQLAQVLENMWGQPVARSALNPALLPIDCLARSGISIQPDSTEVQEDDGVLRLPEMPSSRKEPEKKSGWLRGLFGKQS